MFYFLFVLTRVNQQIPVRSLDVEDVGLVPGIKKVLLDPEQTWTDLSTPEQGMSEVIRQGRGP